MREFSKEEKGFIQKTKKQISDLEKEQERIYAILVKDLKINKEAEDWLFDYIFNDNGSLKDIEKRRN